MALCDEELLLLLVWVLVMSLVSFVMRAFNRRFALGALEGTNGIHLVAGDGNDVATPWHLEDVVAMVGHCHELGQG